MYLMTPTWAAHKRESGMPLKDMFNPICALAARTCEMSPFAADLVRNLDFKGKGRIVQRIRSDAFARDVVATCDGIQYQLDLRDDIQREMYFNVYETNEVKLALELIPVGGTCLDIGANNGAFALKFAKKVGPAGTVHAYEPDPAIFSRLSANCRLNGFESVLHCHCEAVSNVTGPVPFHGSAPGHSGWGSLVQFSDIAAQTEPVDATTVDSIVQGEKLDQVDLMKIDVEAHEPEVLAGAARSLARQTFRYILIEFNGIRLAERGKTLHDFLRPLHDAGYSPVRLRVDLVQKMLDRHVAPETVVANFLFAPLKRASVLRQ
jgi:FkbM family methyltransferase